MKDKTILILSTVVCLIASIIMTILGTDHQGVAWIATCIFGICVVIQMMDESEMKSRGCRMLQSEL